RERDGGGAAGAEGDADAGLDEPCLALAGLGEVGGGAVGGLPQGTRGECGLEAGLLDVHILRGDGRVHERDADIEVVLERGGADLGEGEGDLGEAGEARSCRGGGVWGGGIGGRRRLLE